MNAAPLKHGIMPEELKKFMRLYRGKDSNQELVEVLKLVQHTDPDKLLDAVSLANESGNPTYNLIWFYLNAKSNPLKKIDASVEVDQTDFNGYDSLIPKGEHDYE